MRPNNILMVGLGLVSAAAGAETLTYSYDALGRITKVEHTGTVNNRVVANYAYDKAGNRATVNVSGTPTLTPFGPYPPTIQGSTVVSPSNQPVGTCSGVFGSPVTGSGAIEAKRPPMGTWLMMGLDLNQNACDNVGASHHYMIFVTDTGTVYWEEDGPPADAVYSTSAQHIRMVYQGTTLQVFGDNILIFSVSAAANQTLYPKLQLVDPNVTIQDVHVWG